MTIEEAIERVAEIRRIAGDDESAHSMEDELRRAVLDTIANGPRLTHDEIRELAKVALSTGAIDFERWCA